MSLKIKDFFCLPLRLNSSSNILTVIVLCRFSYLQRLLFVSLCLKSNSLIPLLNTLTDHRCQSGNFKHTLLEILFLAFSAVLCGYDDGQSIVLFGNYQKDWLPLYLPYKNGIPSHDTMEGCTTNLTFRYHFWFSL